MMAGREAEKADDRQDYEMLSVIESLKSTWNAVSVTASVLATGLQNHLFLSSLVGIEPWHSEFSKQQTGGWMSHHEMGYPHLVCVKVGRVRLCWGSCIEQGLLQAGLGFRRCLEWTRKEVFTSRLLILTVCIYLHTIYILFTYYDINDCSTIHNISQHLVASKTFFGRRFFKASALET